MAKEINKNNESNSPFTFVFGKINYIIMLVDIVLLALGYIFLSGGGSDDPNVFNPAMFDSRRLYVAPILIILGLIAEIVAIMYNGKRNEQ
jgi:hypothetical protein